MGISILRVDDVDKGPIARCVRELETATRRLVAGDVQPEGAAEIRGYARGLAFAMNAMTALSSDEIRAAIMQRIEERG